MKKGFIIACVFALVFTSCLSTPNPEEFYYKEISAFDYLHSNKKDLYKISKSYKITNAFIKGAYMDSTKRVFLKISDSFNGDGFSMDACDFVLQKNKTDSDWAKRIDAVSGNTKFDGHYIVYMYFMNVGNWLDGYRLEAFIYKIDGIPSQEQINAEKAEQERIKAEKEAAAEAERLAKEEADKKARAEKIARLNAAGKKLADGYVYHGVEENSKNCKLFINGALESGHAYYISGFVVKYSGTMAAIEYGDGIFVSSQSSAVYVDYVSQKVKAEIVLEAASTNFFGKTIENPINVVISGGNGNSQTPIVLGKIEE